MRIWRGGPGEAAAVAGLLAEFRDSRGGSEPHEEEIAASVRRIMEGGDGEYLLGASSPDGPAAGVCQLRFRWSIWKSAEDAWLEDLFVRAEARRSGLGRALVEAAVARARERGCRRIELDVDEDNAPARALYAACGFSERSKSPGRTLFVGRPL